MAILLASECFNNLLLVSFMTHYSLVNVILNVSKFPPIWVSHCSCHGLDGSLLVGVAQGFKESKWHFGINLLIFEENRKASLMGSWWDTTISRHLLAMWLLKLSLLVACSLYLLKWQWWCLEWRLECDMAISDGPKDYTKKKGQFEGLEWSLHVKAQVEYQSPLLTLRVLIYLSLRTNKAKNQLQNLTWIVMELL